MTSAIIAQNPNGSDYIYYLPDYMLEDMPEELVEKIQKYNQLYDYYQNTAYIDLDVNSINAVIDTFAEQYNNQYKNDKRELKLIDTTLIGYPNLMLAYYEAEDLYYYVSSGMMPVTGSIDAIDATSEAKKLTLENLNPLALPSVHDQTSIQTIESALRNYCKVYAKSGYVKITPVTTDLTEEAELDANDNSYKLWTGYIKVSNYSDENDIKYAGANGVVDNIDNVIPMTIKVYDEYDAWMKQKILKSIASDDEDGNNVYEILEYIIYDKFSYEIEEDKVESFKNAIKLYSLARVKSFADAFQTALDVLTEAGQTEHSLYAIYYRKMIECQKRVDGLSEVLLVVEDFISQLEGQKTDIQKELNLREYLGEDLYKIFSMYRREDEYSNSNFISDNLNDFEVFDMAKQFFTEALKEIKKAATPQHTISANLYNLLEIEEFAPLVNKFKLGNWLRIRVDDEIYRLRLISWSGSSDDDANINVEFSDVTYAPGVLSDFQSLMSKTQSMATSYSYIQKQADKTEKTTSKMNDWMRDGLNSALINIKNNNNEEVTIDNHGILARAFNPDIGEYSPEQVRITGNSIVMTEDNWQTASVGLGKSTFVHYDKDADAWIAEEDFGVQARSINSGHIMGTEIVGGEIYSDNYSYQQGTGTYINLETGDFSMAGGIISYNNDEKKFKIDYTKAGLSESKEIGDINETLKELESTNDVIRTELAVGLESVNVSINNFTKDFAEHFDFTEEGINISNTGTGTSLLLSDDEISFRTPSSSKAVATITAEQMDITRGNFSQLIRIGAFAFMPRINRDGTYGNLRLVKFIDAPDKLLNNNDFNADTNKDFVNNNVQDNNSGLVRIANYENLEV